jgi:glycosyltransferase involved in cell wall biosynthesis
MAFMSVYAHIALNAHLLSGEASYRSAGIHGYLYNTLAHLPEVDPDLTYTVFVGKGQLPDHSGWSVRRSRLPTQRPSVRIMWEQFIAPIELARLQPDLLHGMAFALPLVWPAPSVVTIFDLSFLRYPDRLSASRRLYLRFITRVSARRASRVIAISESSKAEIVTLFSVPAERIEVAVPGVGAAFRPLPPASVADFRRQNNLPEQFILHVGTLEPRKNLDTLLRAYARLPQRGAVKLVLVGGMGWQTEPLFALIEKLGLERDVLMAGYVTTESLPLWYNAAKVFAYPSVYEGFGMPLLEAMACGLPVVASNTSSLPEAVGSDGLLLPPDDAEAWADALSGLLNDESTRAELSARGRRRAQSFSWAHTAQQMVATYRHVLNSKRGSNGAGT